MTIRATLSKWLAPKMPGSENLLSEPAFRKVLAKERHRCDRYGIQFGLLLFEANQDSHDSSDKQYAQLGKCFSDRLRITDEMGLLNSRLAIVLPHTGRRGTCQVMDTLKSIAAEAGIYCQCQAQVYPDDASDDSTENRLDSDTFSTPPFSDSIFDDAPFKKGSGDSSVAIANRAELDRETSQSKLAVGSVPPSLLCDPYPTWKRTIDIVGSAAGLIVASPLLLAAAMLIKATSRGPVFYTQSRTGYLGQRFTIFKLRSMVIDADAKKLTLVDRNERDGPTFKIANDPRVTLVGRLLRKYGIDELPQLWNVLRGDMALVGPRPLPVDEADKCNQWQRGRGDSKPGLTCTWQVKKSEAISFTDWMRLDLNYCRKRSLGKDIRLIFSTALTILRGRAEN